MTGEQLQILLDVDTLNRDQQRVVLDHCYRSVLH